MSTRRILVAGAAGFIGSQVSARLLAAGHTVMGIDNLNDAYDMRLKEWRLGQLVSQSGFEFRRVDIRRRDDLCELFESGVDAVVNLAARAGVRQSIENPWIYTDTNIDGTLNLLDLCREFHVAKFVLASSSSVYGAEAQCPFREDAATDHPLSPYAATKKAGELLAYTYHRLYGLDVTVLRFFTVYGPAGRPDMSPFRFVQWISERLPVMITGDGRQERDFTYVDDIASGTVAALAPLGYEVINLGSDAPVPIIESVHMIEELTGCPAVLCYGPRHPADMLATCADISKAGRLLAWQPRVRLYEGLAATVAWYRENREWARDIVTR
jgi:UDP-glucuronate 4-epimerase